jgi:hypothetical protein
MSGADSSPRTGTGGIVDRHLLRMRCLAALALVMPPLLAAGAFRLPRARSALISPLGMTLLAAAAAAWIVLTAGGDARRRLETVKRGFASHRELATLLREHLHVYLVVLLRLLCVSLCGVVTAGWGSGPIAAVWFFLATVVLIATTWPTRRKTELLIARASAKL